MGGGPYAKNSGPSLIDEAGVLSKLGVIPNKVVELKALTGDSSDNIPGVKGVGPKTAITLLKENGDLDGIYNALAEVEAEGEKASRGAIKGALKSKLSNDRDNAYLSLHLAEILVDIPLPKAPRLELGSVDNDGLADRLSALELNSLVRQVPSFVATFSSGGFKANRHELEPSRSATSAAEPESSTETKASNDNELPALEPQLITNPEELQELVKRLMGCRDRLKPVAIDTETTALNPFCAELVGLGVCWGEGLQDLAYIPIGHHPPAALLDLSLIHI